MERDINSVAMELLRAIKGVSTASREGVLDTETQLRTAYVGLRREFYEVLGDEDERDPNIAELIARDDECFRNLTEHARTETMRIVEQAKKNAPPEPDELEREKPRPRRIEKRVWSQKTADLARSTYIRMNSGSSESSAVADKLNDVKILIECSVAMQNAGHSKEIKVSRRLQAMMNEFGDELRACAESRAKGNDDWTNLFNRIGNSYYSDDERDEGKRIWRAAVKSEKRRRSSN